MTDLFVQGQLFLECLKKSCHMKHPDLHKDSEEDDSDDCSEEHVLHVTVSQQETK